MTDSSRTNQELIQENAFLKQRIRELEQSESERKRTEEALRESQAFYHSLVEQLPAGVFRKDREGRFVFVSPWFCRLKGMKAEEFLGKTPLEVIANEAAKPIANEQGTKYATEGADHHVRIMQKGNPVELVEEYTDAAGRKQFVHAIKIPVFNSEGEVIGTQGVLFDITENKRGEEERRSLQERLQRAEKMEALGQLAGGVAHDLNNVLGILTGYSELLLLELPEGHRSRGHAEKILQSTEKGAAIIQDLLTLARRSVTVSDVINLNNIVSGFLETPVFDKIKDYHPRVIFRTEYDKNLLNIKGSPIHLEKTLMNLCSNAVESISGSGEVTIRTESRYLDTFLRGYDEVKEGDYAVLTVSDTGMGIPAENIEKIFEPFYTKKMMGRSGTGLGLAIVWGTVKDHNGYIDVQTKVGEGTTFTLYFPVTREEMVAPHHKEPIERYMGSGESVLVVDDIAEQRDVAARLLTRLGYNVRVVSSGEEAVEYLKSSEADILVLDMIMSPGIDGLETYQSVLEINPKQKAILVSGFSETERVKEAQRLGAGAYVRKPYVIETIGIAIRDGLSR
jgi:two-component system, cell cycle sensor histidine kinase and response regulator CckA